MFHAGPMRALKELFAFPMAALFGVAAAIVAHTFLREAPVTPPRDAAPVTPPRDAAPVTPPRDAAPAPRDAGPPDVATPPPDAARPKRDAARRKRLPCRGRAKPTGDPGGWRLSGPAARKLRVGAEVILAPDRDCEVTDFEGQRAVCVELGEPPESIGKATTWTSRGCR